MAIKKVLVLGGNFGGLTAALELKHELDEEVSVRVVSTSDRFVFNPSLIWLPFGKREAADITFPLDETFDAHGVDFVHATAIAIDPVTRSVTTTAGTYSYDYLVIATGYRNNFDEVPGLGPDGFAHTITTLADAEATGLAWRKFLNNPGPVVVAATQGASCFGAAYEFLFNVHHQLGKAKLSVPLTFITSEPFLGHFGIGGLKGGETMLKKHLAKIGVTAMTGPRRSSGKTSSNRRPVSATRRDTCPSTTPTSRRPIPRSMRSASPRRCRCRGKPPCRSAFRRPGCRPKRWQRSLRATSRRRSGGNRRERIRNSAIWPPSACWTRATAES